MKVLFKRLRANKARTLGLALLVFGSLLILAGKLDFTSGDACRVQRTGGVQAIPPVSTTQTLQGPSYATMLRELDESIIALNQRSLVQMSSWLAREMLAGAYIARARLTGRYEDYVAAEEALETAFQLAKPGAGPFLTRARLNFTLHRLDRAQQDLEAVERRLLLDDRTHATVLGLRADVAFQLGELEEAKRGFVAALEERRTPTSLSRLAHYKWRTGDEVGADALLAEALGLVHGAQDVTAWLHLQRGLIDLEAGRLHAALSHYQSADATLPGWWLIEEHIAEVLALLGQTSDARQMYEDLVERTQNPEFMDALAVMARVRGDEEAADAWIHRAGQVYMQRLAVFPQATYGHALQHFLDFGDARVAVALAKKNRARRPNPEAYDLFAQAALKAGSIEAARAALDFARSTGWSSAALRETTAALKDAWRLTPLSFAP